MIRLSNCNGSVGVTALTAGFSLVDRMFWRITLRWPLWVANNKGGYISLLCFERREGSDAPCLN